MQRRIALAVVVFLFLCASWALSQPQPPVYRDRVEPHWFADNTRFWYRNNLRNEAREFILVDAAKGTRTPAFDHAKVASALGKALNRQIATDKLPIDSLEFDRDASSLTLVLRDDAAGSAPRTSVPGNPRSAVRTPPPAFLLDLRTYELRPTTAVRSDASLVSGRRVRPSRRTGPETSITFINRLPAEVRIFWIDTEGQRRPYGTLKPNEERDQHTFAGHVWLATDAAGNVLAVFEATEQRSDAIISAQPTSRPAAQTAPARQRFRGGGSRRGGNSPDGKWSVFVRDSNLHVRSIAGGQEFALSSDGKPDDGYSATEVWWSPDSQKLLAMRTAKAQEHKVYIVESSPPDQLQPRLRTLDYLKPGDRIAHPRPQLFHISTRKQIALKDDLFPNPWSIGELRWAADSSRFTFVYNQRGHQVLRLVAVDASTGAARPVIDEQSDTFICYSGKYFCDWIGENEIIWMSERDGWNHLWLYDAQTGQVENQITRGPWVVQAVTRVDPEKRQVWFRAGGIRPGQDPYYTHCCRVNFDGSGLVVLTEGDGNHSVQWSPDQPYFIDTWSRVDQPPINELRSSDDGHLVCRLEEADASEALSARGGRWPQRFVARGRDGVTDIYGVIIRPRNFDPARKYPVVENIYAGPQGFFTPKSFRARFGHQQAIADLGMIVVQCDGMGTSGRSKKFHNVCFKNLRDAGFPDRIAWIKAAAAANPEMDLARVGIYGGSAGGQNAMAALLWHNDFYKVAVADCGCHDNRMDKIWWNEQWMSWPIGPHYAENSNAVNARLLQGKLMLIFGELDSNVDPASTMQVVNALEKANKDFDLVIVTGSNHGAAETPYGSRRRSDFLARNLLGKQ